MLIHGIVASRKQSAAASGWDLSNATYEKKSPYDFWTSNPYYVVDSNPMHVRFKSDGTKFFVNGWGSDKIDQITVSNAWEIDSLTTSCTDQYYYSNPYGMHLHPSGTSVFTLQGGGSSIVRKYPLSTAWDVTTPTPGADTFKSIYSQVPYPYGLFLRDDGKKLYVTNKYGIVYQYKMTTAWTLSTLSYESKNADLTSQLTTSREVYFNPDGNKMFVSDYNTESIYQYSLSTPWDLSTVSYDNVYLDVSSNSNNTVGFCFNIDGTKFYFMGYNSSDGRRVFQYSL